MDNIFNIDSLPIDSELFDTIFHNKNVKIERILSKGQVTKDGEWYNQETDEWVILIQGNAKIEFENHKIIELNSGDYIFIPSHQKHKVIFTSVDPICIWIAVHIEKE
ncbi:MAG: cupin domain-containing protein [Bacteroidetes bacterium]|nr:cupin domain-containing protein [Bacteroidota bacterium]